MTSKKPVPAPVASFQAPSSSRRTREGQKPLPVSPDVDEEGLARAEQEMYGNKARAGRTIEGHRPRRNPKAKRKSTEATLYIRGPQPVVDAFNRFKETQGYDSAWRALEELLLSSGEQVEDFEV